MFENKYDFEKNVIETEYVPVEENLEDKNKIKKNSFRKKVKVFISAICVVAISVSSVSTYKYFDNKNNLDSSVNIEDKSFSSAEVSTEKLTASTENYSTANLLELSKSENALSTQEIYTKVLPSVVGVSASFSNSQSNSNGNYFGYGMPDGNYGEQDVTGTGTGIVMSTDGYILTNAHVIYSSSYGEATEVSILMFDETEYTAKVVAFDAQTDVAVLKVEASGLVAAEFGDSSELQVGDTAIAIGNPLGFDLFGTLTVGYISGLNREVSANDMLLNLIQTDAAINSGNSGGPLVNDSGQVIGINSMKMSSSYTSATIEGLGFAIPINEAKEIVDELLANGYVTGRPQIGITCRAISENSQYSGNENISATGLLIEEVAVGGAAELAGLQSGDIIVSADGIEVTTVQELNDIKNKHNAGDILKLTVIRNNQQFDFEVTLAEAKSN